jgi:aquaporin Z
MKKYIVEFIGTFFLVLTVGLTVRGGNELIASAIAIGSVLMVMIYSGGHISGGHFNPAVTLAVTLRGKASPKDLIPYWVAQFAAGALAALLVTFLFEAPAEVHALHGTVPSLIVEFLFTFALAWAVLNTATAKGTSGNSFYGLAIGFTVVVGAITVGKISGGAFNPAVGLGVVTMGLVKVQQLGVYLVADLAGGAAAALAFRSLNGPE